MFIRSATPQDAAALLAIYSPFVTDTTVTLETTPPTVTEFATRIHQTLVDYPYLVAVNHGECVGYAYAHRYKERPGYDWTVEVSIYVAQSGQGIGKMLYAALETTLCQQHVQTVMACVTGANAGSRAFHEHQGFQSAGVFEHVGYKLGQWLDIHWFEKRLATGAPAPFIPYRQLHQAASKRAQ